MARWVDIYKMPVACLLHVGSLNLGNMSADIYSEVDEEKFNISDNQCYAATSDTGKICNDMGKAIASSRNRESKKSRENVVLFVVLLLAMVAACVAFAVEISKLKSKTASLQMASLLKQSQNMNTTQQLCREINQLAAAWVWCSCPFLPFGLLCCSPSLLPYWVRTPTGSAVFAYCDPTRSCGGVTGGWRRVAGLDMTNSSQQCPSALRQHNDNNIRICGTDPNRDCSSLTFPTDSLSYSKVCGKIGAYQVGTTDSFGDGIIIGRNRSNDIDTNYLDGVSLTHGTPRQHIWSFAAAPNEVDTPPLLHCPCINRDQASSAARPPAFVGNDYFCDTGSSCLSIVVYLVVVASKHSTVMTLCGMVLVAGL